jgi:hypothetical protein
MPTICQRPDAVRRDALPLPSPRTRPATGSTASRTVRCGVAKAGRDSDRSRSAGGRGRMGPRACRAVWIPRPRSQWRAGRGCGWLSDSRSSAPIHHRRGRTGAHTNIQARPGRQSVSVIPRIGQWTGLSDPTWHGPAAPCRTMSSPVSRALLRRAPRFVDCWRAGPESRGQLLACLQANFVKRAFAKSAIDSAPLASSPLVRHDRAARALLRQEGRDSVASFSCHSLLLTFAPARTL